MLLYQVTDTTINQSYTSMIHIRSDKIAGKPFVPIARTECILFAEVKEIFKYLNVS